MDTFTRTRETDSIDATQDAPSHRSNKKKAQDEKPREKRRQRINERQRIGRRCKMLTKLREPTRTKETARIQDVTKTATYPSRVTQMTTWTPEVEEEEWIEYITRSTRDAEDKLRAANIPCWIDAQVESSENCFAPWRKMDKKAATWNPGPREA